MNVITEFFVLVDSLLPPLSDEITGAFHMIALAGLAYGFDVEIVSFKGERIRVFGQYVTTRDAIIGIVATLAIIATYSWWSKSLYNVFVLTGWQASGVVCIEVTWLILSKSHRNMDEWTFGLLVDGIILLTYPWMV